MVLLWTAFIVVVLSLLALDLFVFHRKDATPSIGGALKWSAFWIALALVFNVAVYFMYAGNWFGLADRTSALHPGGISGLKAASLFFTGYVVEQSLSVDNLFVMAVIFSYFGIPSKYQHRVLFWGIIGVLIMRGLMIGLGTALIHRFEWLLYVFGVILLLTAYKMLFGDGEADPKKNPLLRLAKRYFPITHEFHGHAFVVSGRQVAASEQVDVPDEERGGSQEPSPASISPLPPDSADSPAKTPVVNPVSSTPTRATRSLADAKWVLTPLALALVVIETTDLIFAVDSIPAIFAITTDPFLVFTSNVFAVLGLRSLFFALSGVLDKFKYLKVSLSAILAVVGLKMLAHHWIAQAESANFLMLGVVVCILTAGIVASMIAARRHPAETATTETPVT